MKSSELYSKSAEGFETSLLKAYKEVYKCQTNFLELEALLVRESMNYQTFISELNKCKCRPENFRKTLKMKDRKKETTFLNSANFMKKPTSSSPRKEVKYKSLAILL
jgi:hypothetical protein